MTRDEFQNLIHKFEGGPIKKGRGKKATYHPVGELKETWSFSVSTSDCWDNHYLSYHDYDIEPDFCNLNNILLEINPNLSFSQYINFIGELKKLIKYTDNIVDEYYGNYSIKITKTIKIDDIWDCLLKTKILD